MLTLYVCREMFRDYGCNMSLEEFFTILVVVAVLPIVIAIDILLSIPELLYIVSKLYIRRFKKQWNGKKY